MLVSILDGWSISQVEIKGKIFHFLLYIPTWWRQDSNKMKLNLSLQKLISLFSLFRTCLLLVSGGFWATQQRRRPAVDFSSGPRLHGQRRSAESSAPLSAPGVDLSPQRSAMQKRLLQQRRRSRTLQRTPPSATWAVRSPTERSRWSVSPERTWAPCTGRRSSKSWTRRAWNWCFWVRTKSRRFTSWWVASRSTRSSWGSGRKTRQKHVRPASPEYSAC